jgi:hypothetical protein
MVNCLEFYGNIEPGGNTMIIPDFTEKTYIAEVLKTAGDASSIVDAIARLAVGPKTEELIEENVGGQISESLQEEEFAGYNVRLIHTFLASPKAMHRNSREVRIKGEMVVVPRVKNIRGTDQFLYDLIIAQSRNHIVIAVPFHELAESFFVKLDRALSGKQIAYERLDITRLVLRLGATGRTDILLPQSGGKVSLQISRCHLGYEYPDRETANLHQIHISGSNLGASEEYQTLIAPVLEQHQKSVKVTPLVLGFSLIASGVKKSSAATDRHGNFKLWVAARLKRISRLFALLESISALKSVITTTPNVPILLSGTIKKTEVS